MAGEEDSSGRCDRTAGIPMFENDPCWATIQGDGDDARYNPGIPIAETRMVG